MFYLRSILTVSPLLQFQTRSFKTIFLKEMTIHPNARINISTNIYTKVRTCDLSKYPSANGFIIDLRCTDPKKAPPKLDMKMDADQKLVDVSVTQNSDIADFQCDVKVPLASDLYLDAKDGVNVGQTISHEVHIKAEKNIKTKNIRATLVQLASKTGWIRCEGLIMATDITAETKGDKYILIGKLEGDKAICKTESGDIITDSVYVDGAKFETNDGCLWLRNVHRRAEIFMHKNGQIHITGVRGNIQIHASQACLNMQVSAVEGLNYILTDTGRISFGDRMFQSAYIEVCSPNVTVDESLSKWKNLLSKDKKYWRLIQKVKGYNANKLLICAKHDITIASENWVQNTMDMLKGDKKCQKSQ